MTTIQPPSPLSAPLSEEAHQAAYELVRFIEASLSQPQHNGMPRAAADLLGACHWRTREGQLLRTLDEVIRAILSDDLDLSPVGARS